MIIYYKPTKNYYSKLLSIAYYYKTSTHFTKVEHSLHMGIPEILDNCLNSRQIVPRYYDILLFLSASQVYAYYNHASLIQNSRQASRRSVILPIPT